MHIFRGGNGVFYQSGKIYVLSIDKLTIVDEKNYTRQEIEMPLMGKAFLHGKFLYYIKINIDSAGKSDYVIEKFDIEKKERIELVKLNEIIKELGFDKFDEQKLYVYDNKMYISSILHSSNKGVDKLLEVDLQTKDVNLIDKEMSGYQYQSFYLSEGKVKYIYTAFDENDEDVWKKRPQLCLDNDKEFKLNLFETRVYSNSEFIETSLSALAINKTFKIKEPGFTEREFIIRSKGKELKIPDSLYKENNEFDVKLSNTGDILISYRDGSLAVVRDGKIYEVFK